MSETAYQPDNDIRFIKNPVPEALKAHRRRQALLAKNAALAREVPRKAQNKLLIPLFSEMKADAPARFAIVPHVVKPDPIREALRNSTTARAKEMLLAIAEKHGVTVQEIIGRRRFSNLIAARFEAVYEITKATGWSLPRIGRLFNRDHTTILHCLRVMEGRKVAEREGDGNPIDGAQLQA